MDKPGNFRQKFGNICIRKLAQRCFHFEQFVFLPKSKHCLITAHC